MAAVLIVDDQLTAAQVLARLLRSVGHDAACAGGGTEALRILHTSPADVVVLDVMMPDVDGFAVLRRLRSDPRFASLPVLMYSALDDEETRAEAMEAGAQAYLVKGCMRWPDLQAAIELHVGPRAQTLRSASRHNGAADPAETPAAGLARPAPPPPTCTEMVAVPATTYRSCGDGASTASR